MMIAKMVRIVKMNPEKLVLLVFLLVTYAVMFAQLPVDTKAFRSQSGVSLRQKDNTLSLRWPAGNGQRGVMVLDFTTAAPLLQSIGLQTGNATKIIAQKLDPVFLLTVGKRDLVSQNGWNIFFDKVPLKPYQAYAVALDKRSAAVKTEGSRTVVSIGTVSAAAFAGRLEITLYNGSPLFNVAAIMSTQQDSTAILYDAGLRSKEPWQSIGWDDALGLPKTITPETVDTATAEAVKYRTIVGSTTAGSLAVFPAPHQYFYPLDEAFNLKFTWHGRNYRKMIDGYGIGIRQDLFGDRRFVPWFNAPPGAAQRLNFFCLLNKGDAQAALADVKRFTNNDAYPKLPGYKTMSSHFHNEFVMSVVLAGKPVPDTPNFIKVFKQTGVDIVHLGEFHYTAHPKGPDSLRLNELDALFTQCRRLSDKEFLLLPGEEPNEFFGGHWLELFPKPVYWIMSRNKGEPFAERHPKYGTVYNIGNAADMLELLQKESGLAWTAHPRTKGSTGYPDKYKSESFFTSDRFMGAAWKAMPADLSQPRLGKRVLDLIDDMNNWGLKKTVLAEADLFTVEPENEMYAHLNVNYLRLDNLPSFDDGWQPVLDAVQHGTFFSTTGEVLIPFFTVNGKSSGGTASIGKSKAQISFNVKWTFPLQAAEIISGDGGKVYRHRINLDATLPFGEQTFSLPLNLTGRKWVRLEVWDAAVNGAFTQTVWLQE